MTPEKMHPLTLPIRKAQNMRLLVHTVFKDKIVARWRRPEFENGIWLIKAGGKIHPVISYRTTERRYPTFYCGTPITPTKPRTPRRKAQVMPGMRYVARPELVLFDVLVELERATAPNRELITAVRKLMRST